ncbi:MAG: hypothetical protein ABI968_08270 [Acidobacteriota bacterium]
MPGLTEPRALSLERFAVRTRDSAVTRSAWRLAVGCEQGDGAIILVEGAPAETFLRGEGIFLGWSPERLGMAYRALLPRSPSPGFELNQLG